MIIFFHSVVAFLFTFWREKQRNENPEGWKKNSFSFLFLLYQWMRSENIFILHAEAYMNMKFWMICTYCLLGVASSLNAVLCQLWSLAWKIILKKKFESIKWSSKAVYYKKGEFKLKSWKHYRNWNRSFKSLKYFTVVR